MCDEPTIDDAERFKGLARAMQSAECWLQDWECWSKQPDTLDTWVRRLVRIYCERRPGTRPADQTDFVRTIFHLINREHPAWSIIEERFADRIYRAAYLHAIS